MINNIVITENNKQKIVIYLFNQVYYYLMHQIT
jgi:hypothetical protein